MVKEKKLIERELPFSQTYIYLGMTRGSIESGQLTTCDNCGKLITNMVSLGVKETGRQHTIGVDCMQTLVKAKSVLDNGTQTDYQTDIYVFNKVLRFVTEVNAGVEFENNGFWCTLTNRKGKEMTEFTQMIEKYFPEILPLAKPIAFG